MPSFGMQKIKKRCAASFARNRSGNIATYFCLTLLPIFLLIGGAVDLRRSMNNKEALRHTIDASVLAAISRGGTEEEMVKSAKSYFDSTIVSRKLSDMDVETEFWLEEGVLYGTVKGNVPTTFLGLAGISNIDVGTKVGATVGGRPQPACFMAMHWTRHHTLELKKAVHVYAPDCHIYGNSEHPFDVVDPHTPQTFLTGKTVQAIGYGHHYLENVSPPLVRAGSRIPDPFQAMPIPAPKCSGSISGNYGHGKHTLNPGNYCNGLTAGSGAELTLRPGLYVISGGDFSLNNATVEGNDVTLALADKDVVLDWTDSRVILSAPKLKKPDNPYQSMAMIGVRKAGRGEPSGGGILNEHKISETFVDIHGVVYLPNGQFEWEHDGSEIPIHKWTSWIVDGVTWTGTGKLFYNFKPAESDIPFPAALMTIPTPGTKLETVSHKKWSGEMLVWDDDDGQPRLVK